MQQGVGCCNGWYHTAGSDTIFVQIYMDPPPGVPGVSKNQIFFSQIKLLSFCANIAPQKHKLQKTIKIEKKCKKTPCFLRLFCIFFILGVILAHQTSNSVFSDRHLFWQTISKKQICHITQQTFWMKGWKRLFFIMNIKSYAVDYI